jgi:hypothetical protein
VANVLVPDLVAYSGRATPAAAPGRWPGGGAGGTFDAQTAPGVLSDRLVATRAAGSAPAHSSIAAPLSSEAPSASAAHPVAAFAGSALSALDGEGRPGDRFGLATGDAFTGKRRQGQRVRSMGLARERGHDD